MMQKETAVAIDLGGTNLRLALVSRQGRISHWEQRNTPRSRQVILDLIIDRTEAALESATTDGLKVIGVGVSTGGRVDFTTGTVVSSTSLIEGWQEVRLKDAVEKRLGMPTIVDNDGNCSAIAERVFGKAKSVDNFISVALGTGIGGGIFAGGRILRGENNYAAEIGHVTVNAEGPKCSCGGYGCVELYASGSGIVRWAIDDFPSIARQLSDHRSTAKFISELARSGDKSAIDLLNKAGKMLGAAAASWVDIFNPSLMVLSGSLTGLGESYFGPFRKTLHSRAIKPNADFLRIEFSDFHNEAGVVGAAALVFQNFELEPVEH